MGLRTAARRKLTQSRTKPGVIFTYEDYAQFPDDGKRYEIIEGELFMVPSPMTKHQLVSQAIEAKLERFFLKKHPMAVYLHAPVDVILSDTNVVQPDICVILNEHRSIITEKNIAGAPDFLIEILSPSNRAMDVRKKRALYEKYGVKEYWIVDPDIETIQKSVLKKGRFVDAGTFERGDKITSHTLPRFQIQLKNIFLEP